MSPTGTLQLDQFYLFAGPLPLNDSLFLYIMWSLDKALSSILLLKHLKFPFYRVYKLQWEKAKKRKISITNLPQSYVLAVALSIKFHIIILLEVL